MSLQKKGGKGLVFASYDTQNYNDHTTTKRKLGQMPIFNRL